MYQTHGPILQQIEDACLYKYRKFKFLGKSLLIAMEMFDVTVLVMRVTTLMCILVKHIALVLQISEDNECPVYLPSWTIRQLLPCLSEYTVIGHFSCVVLVQTLQCHS